VKLFQSIIIQDIAFFDGVNTGELTSRLSSDANAMVQPCQTVLNTFLSNALLLIGGLVMCFVTSWRLSILAITSIGPILQVTRAYAVWSQQINRDIWVPQLFILPCPLQLRIDFVGVSLGCFG
jgi:ATP-binding cassette subfamily B protein